MIQRIGVIYQDVYSRGFLEGLKLRLACHAELVPTQGNVGRSKHMKRRNARNACLFLLGKNVDVIIRFTDADGADWQDVKRRELDVFPASVREILVIGVALNNPEEWLALTPDYLAAKLGIDARALRNDPDKSSVIKCAIDVQCRTPDGLSDVAGFVARLLADAPSPVFRMWLREDSFKRFYQECRGIASRFECDTRNEL